MSSVHDPKISDPNTDHDTRVEPPHYEDLLCVGFGPASLAIAVAIHDIFQQEINTGDDVAFPRVRFLEKQTQFGWHGGMLLPHAKMQISFVKDLATLRDPTSKFTFLNYLKTKGRLVQFANLDTFLPLRTEFEDYLKWTARHFEDQVKYAQEVICIRPSSRKQNGKVTGLEVVSRNTITGATCYHFAKNVVIAAGGQPSIPKVFPATSSRLIHSSRYNYEIDLLLRSRESPYNIAVIGSGQSAAEVFDDLHFRFPNSRTSLIFRDTALRPSDDSPFVNEIFNPEIIDTFFSSQALVRQQMVQRNKATNYSVVRLELLEKIYEYMYHQRINEPDPDKWQHQILPSREIVAASEDHVSKGISLTIANSSPPSLSKSTDTILFDAVVLATGYQRNAHVKMLNDCAAINGSKDGNWMAERDYQVSLNRDIVEPDVQIFLQGCNEATHGLSDSLLSVLATRSGEIVRSIFGHHSPVSDGYD